MKRVLSIVGGRPHPMKVAPIARAFAQIEDIDHRVLDLGFMEFPYARQSLADVQMADPDWIVPAEDRVSRPRFLTAIRRMLDEAAPDHLLIYGDVDSSVDTSVVAQTMCIPFSHVEAGLRSNDTCDHEETSRRFLDRYSDLYVTHSQSAVDNLLADGADKDQILLTANPAIESLRSWLGGRSQAIKSGHYILASVHRREALKSRARLVEFLQALEELTQIQPVRLVLYQSTARALDQWRLVLPVDVEAVPTMPYGRYIDLLGAASLVVSDSSGSLDEATYLGTPTVVCRDRTHRPDVQATGLVKLAGMDHERIVQFAREYLSTPPAVRAVPSMWERSAGADVASFFHKRIFGA